MKKRIAHWFLRRTGWRIEGVRPEQRRFVMIAAPHTSNWDFPYMLAFAAVYDLDVRWLGKHSLFIPPLGWVLRLLGGVPVIRHKNKSLVADMIDTFNEMEDIALAVPTEGTRTKAEYWKSGFYHIARGAQVPIVPSYLDYSKKCGGFGPALMPTGDLRADMDYFRSFYEGKAGKFPENFGPIRLREEAQD
jgi:1-acyl-sn-glycerol-3-phosphate acyltransferase